VQRLTDLSQPGCEFWIKRDDLTSPRYGGNKVRKLEYVLGEARAQGKTELLTAGAAGSHHVLATTLFGKEHGFDVRAVLIGQPRSAHAEENLRAGLSLGLVAHASRDALVPLALARRYRRSTYFVQVGGSSVLGAMGYVDAARELATQVRAGQMPMPDIIVVTLGSGGTAAGLAAGLALEGMPTKVLGVAVVGPTPLFVSYTHLLARRCLQGEAAKARRALHLETTTRWLGQGYAHPTPEGERAVKIAAEAGVVLDSTYTGKSFAAALALVSRREAGVVLHWNTLSSVAPPVPDDGRRGAVPRELAGLFRDE
jgi:1-aminocyclopropane-1-carboxylate deaminase/D-cysteine desulfhydrase-like pyridoxal-dependent ACC family enzyme